MAYQPFIRRGFRSNATARRLIATSQSIAPHVLKSTIEDKRISQPVMRCLAEQTALIAGVVVFVGEHFYLVESEKFSGRFYVAKRNQRTQQWQCSSEQALPMCVRRIENYVKVLKANKTLQEVA
jgi:surfactin synthase thioesterase subunit